MSAALLTSTMPQEKAPILQALPPELHFNIVKYLDYSTFLALRRTNRYLREVADAVGCSDLEKASLVRAAEQYPRHAKNFGCCRCFRVLPARKFGDKQRKKSYRKGKSNSFSRFCFDCGLRKELYPPGCRIVKDGVEMIYCRECRLVREGQYCHSCWRCWSCLQLSRVGHEPESAAEDVVDVREVIFGSHNRSLSTRDRVPVACPRCRQDKIKGKALEWYECIDDEQELERKWGMAEFEAASGETASPCSQQVSARGGRTTEETKRRQSGIPTEDEQQTKRRKTSEEGVFGKLGKLAASAREARIIARIHALRDLAPSEH